MQFAKTLGISHSKIDGKICSGEHAKGTTHTDNSSVTTYIDEPKANTDTAQCSGLKDKTTTSRVTRGLSKFVSLTKVDEGKNWPTGLIISHDNSKAEKGVPNGNAEAVAKDLVQELTPEEKTIVAGLLAKTIEGGEVVEIREVSSTSVMINFCDGLNFGYAGYCEVLGSYTART